MSGYKGKIEIDVNVQSSFTELTKVQSANVSKIIQEIVTSQFNDAGERREYGRSDFALDVDVNWDLGEATHASILDSMLNRQEVAVKAYPDRDVATEYVEAVCRVFSNNSTLDGSDRPRSTISFSNSDGNDWSYTNS